MQQLLLPVALDAHTRPIVAFSTTSPLRRVAVAASTTATKNRPLNVSDQHRLVAAVPRSPTSPLHRSSAEANVDDPMSGDGSEEGSADELLNYAANEISRRPAARSRTRWTQQMDVELLRKWLLRLVQATGHVCLSLATPTTSSLTLRYIFTV